MNLGIVNGCVTENCDTLPDLDPGQHYVQAVQEMLAPKLKWLLETEDGRRTASMMQLAAKIAVQDRYGMADSWARVLQIVDK